MKNILLGALAAIALLFLAGAAVILGGLADVAADSPHSPLVYRLMETARDRAIARSARSIAVPADLAAPERARRGAGNYDAMCVDCHLAPGQDNSEMRRGLYPQPPKLAVPPAEDEPARQFWVIKHGIKASGMPAWARGGMEDAAIWDLVALIRRLPALSPDQYRQLVATSDGHRHGGLEEHHDHGAPAAPPAEKRVHIHPDGRRHVH